MRAAVAAARERLQFRRRASSHIQEHPYKLAVEPAAESRLDSCRSRTFLSEILCWLGEVAVLALNILVPPPLLVGDVVAVENLSFDAREGEIVGLLGGNGAGKTTTISMILGLLIPTSGSLEVLGTNMLRHRYQVLPRINFSSPYVDLPKRLTSRENLMVYSKLYGVPDPARRLGELAADLAIDGLLDRRFGELSSGQKTRVSLAQSLLN